MKEQEASGEEGVMQIAVTVGLNLEPRHGSRIEPTGESAHLAAIGRGPRRGRILIMDDDSMVRELMHRQLVICGYEVVAAARGEDAVSAFRQARDEGRPFDAVILDLVVASGWGGEQTLGELLGLDPEVKALVCSGTLEGAKAQYVKKGFRGVLGKPYSLASLREELEAMLLPRDGAGQRSGNPGTPGPAEGPARRAVRSDARGENAVEFHVSHESLKATTKCPSGFSCLTGDRKDLCAVQNCVNGKVRIVKCLQVGDCSYRHPFNGGDLCMCPVRKELFTTYKI